MRNILVITLTMLLGIVGCTECNRLGSSSESVECERLSVLFDNLEKENIQMLVFFGEDCNEPVDKATLQEFKEAILQLAGCCSCKTHPLAKEWTEYNRLECIWEHLEKENVQRIAFYGQVLGENTERPEDWHNLWAEINEPGKIKEVIKLLHKAIKKENNKFANEDIVISVVDRMQIITDKHKFIIPISCYRKAMRGVGWTSYELRGRLKEWGFPEPK